MTSSRLSSDSINNVFKVFDATNTGFITHDEMGYALKALGWSRITDADVNNVFLTIDPTGNKKKLSLSEFEDLVRSKQKAVNSPEEILAAFRLFDSEGRGKLSPEDLARTGQIATAQPIHHEMITEIMRIADTDRDGFISFEEFSAVVTKGTFDVEDDDLAKAPTVGKLNSSSQGDKAAAEDGGAKKEGGETPEGATEGSPAAGGGAEEEAAPAPAKGGKVIDVIANVQVTFEDGHIDRAEVRRALKELGYDEDTLPDESFDELFTMSDANGDGKLTRDEYCKLVVGFGEIVEGY